MARARAAGASRVGAPVGAIARRVRFWTRARWLPPLIGLTVIAVTFREAHTLRLREREHVRRAIEMKASVLQSVIVSGVQTRTIVLTGMARRWAVRGLTPRFEWEDDAALFASQYPSFLAIEWVDPSYVVSRVAPVAGNESEVGRDLAADPDRRAALSLAEQRGELVFSRPVDIADGERGLLACVPIGRGSEFSGFIVGVIRLRALIDRVIPDGLASGYQISVFVGDEEIYRNGSFGAESMSEWTREETIPLYGTAWRVVVVPTPGQLLRLGTRIDVSVLLIGSLTALVLTLAIYLVQAARARAREAWAAHHELAGHMAEREHAEAALFEQTAILRSILDSAGDGVIVADADGRILLFNPPAEAIVGRFAAGGASDAGDAGGAPAAVGASEAIDGLYLSDGVTPCPPNELPLARARRGESFDDARAYLASSDGSEEMWLSMSGRPLRRPDGTLRGGVVVFRDVTRRVRAEEDVRRLNAELEARVASRTAELQRSNDELQQFAYVASHDLQEPLRNIASFSGLIARRYKDRLDASADEFIRHITDGVGRMQTLIEDLLSLSHVGTQGHELEPIACGPSLETALAGLQLAIEESGAQITSDSLPTVIGDGSQLGQLFQNLIGNAIKFRGDARPEIHVGAVRRSGEWVISVRDNGIGIERKHLGRIFEIFKRLHGRDDYSGTGIGLAICKKIVERHGGRIWAESDVGKGTTFSFTLREIAVVEARLIRQETLYLQAAQRGIKGERR